LKLTGSLAVITVAALVSLTAFGLAVFSGGNAGALIYYCLGSFGAGWLWWYCRRLLRGVKSIAETVSRDKSAFINPVGDSMLDELGEAINSRFQGNISYMKELEKQVKDLQIKIQLLRRDKRNTDAIIYSIRDAVIVIDEFDRLLMANEAAGKLFGFDFKDSQRKPIDELVKSDEGQLVDFLRRCRQSKAQHTKREIEFSANGQTIVFNVIVSCVYDERKEVCGVVAVLHDITREKEISQMKDDFVSHVSHELKTPLASIMAYSEMLVDGEADDEQTRNEFYSVIQTQAKRLNRLIEDILNISRIESGLIKVDKQPVSLAMLIEEQLRMIKSYAEEKDIGVSWGNIGTNSKDVIVFGQVYADRDMISQVIVNLLSNAVKYTKAGGSVKIENEIDENQSVARVSITDTGVGIPADEVEHVFDKFYRVGANKKHAKGTGLGLNLVKQIIEKVHGGKVFVTSEVGVGSTFGFELPLATVGAAG